MTEGQLGYLLTVARDRHTGVRGAHATVVVKLGGHLYNINNQNWPMVAESLDGWDERWGSTVGKGLQKRYRLMPSRVRLPPP